MVEGAYGAISGRGGGERGMRKERGRERERAEYNQVGAKILGKKHQNEQLQI